MVSQILRPFKPEPAKPVVPAAFDLEAKKPFSDEMGFERPFLVGLYVNGTYKSFFDEPQLDGRDSERAFKAGGCIHEFFRWLTDSPEGRKLQSRSKGKNKPLTVLYGHNAGGFDALHLLRWLRKAENAKNFDLQIISTGSQLLELTVSERSAKAEKEEAPFDDDIDDADEEKKAEEEERKARGRGRGGHGRERGKGKLRIVDKSAGKIVGARRLRTWVFRDSMRLVPGSLDSIGKKLLLESRKIKMAPELGGLSAPASEKRAWEEYNGADCKTVVNLVEVLHKQLDILGGHLKMTLPACSMDLFRRRFLREFLNTKSIDGQDNPFYGKKGIPRERHFPGCRAVCTSCHSEKCYKGCPNAGQVRPECPAAPYGCLHAWLAISPTGARHGGRTEVFHHSETAGRLKYYDRNNSYGAAMTEPMPIRLKHFFESGQGPQTLEECKTYGKHYVGFVECVVTIPESVHIPPLPIVHDGKLVFPVGRFYGRWDWTELRHLEEIGGAIEWIHQSVWYESAPLLRQMMETLFQMRKKARAEGNTPLSETCKLLINACYGKFLMSPERDEIFSAPLGKEPEGAEPLSAEESAYAGEDEPILWRRPKFVEADYFLPHIGGHITALAREALWLQMQKAEKLGGNVFYSDTDSVTTNVEMESSDVLGEWKQEYKEIARLAGDFDSPKSYRLLSLGPECFPDHHMDECERKRKDDDPIALACKGCSKELVHIKGLHRSKHTSENFDKLRRGETVRVPDQPPKLGQLMALDFRIYETASRDKSNLRWADGLDGSQVIGKRVRKGTAPETTPLIFDDATPTIYVQDGRAVETTQRSVFDSYVRWRTLLEQRALKSNQVRRTN